MRRGEDGGFGDEDLLESSGSLWLGVNDTALLCLAVELAEMYGEYLTALTRREALGRLSESMSRAQRMGLQPSAELPNEEQEEHEDERSRVLTILGVAGLASSMLIMMF